MSDFLAHLARRVIASEVAIRPRVISRFEAAPEPALGAAGAVQPRVLHESVTESEEVPRRGDRGPIGMRGTAADVSRPTAAATPGAPPTEERTPESPGTVPAHPRVPLSEAATPVQTLSPRAESLNIVQHAPAERRAPTLPLSPTHAAPKAPTPPPLTSETPRPQPALQARDGRQAASRAEPVVPAVLPTKIGPDVSRPLAPPRPLPAPFASVAPLPVTPQTARSEAAGPAPIHVTIGRIEIRAANAAASIPTREPAAHAAPRLSLDDYLRRQSASI